MSGTLTFNNKDASSFGIRIGGVNPYDAPGREVQTYTVPGRIGAVYPQKDLSQIPNEIREYTAGLFLRAASAEAVQRSMAEIRDWLFSAEGYANLIDSYEPLFYRKAFFTGDFAAIRKGAGQNFEFPLRFSCDPRRFILGGEPFTMYPSQSGSVYTTPATVNGFAIREACKPLIWINNGGDAVTISFTDVTEINSVAQSILYGQLKLVGVEEKFWFDAETLTAYLDDDNKTPANELIDDVIGEIRLGPGQTQINYNSSLIMMTFYPRWWVR